MKSPAKTTKSTIKPLVSAPKPSPAAALKSATPAPASARVPVSPTAPSNAVATLAPSQKSDPKPAPAAAVINAKAKAAAPKSAPVVVKTAAPVAAKTSAPAVVKAATPVVTKPSAPVAAKPAAPAKAKANPEKPGTPETRFLLHEENAHQVFLCGEFNQWSPEATPMIRQPNGAWLAKLALPPGRYQYKFIVDGQWVPDREARESVFNEYGSLNSVIEVKA